jgi:hypothetical protein
VPICLMNSTLIVSTRPRILSDPLLTIDGLVSISSKKSRSALNFADRLLQYIEVRRNLVIICGISNRECLATMSPTT